jgi:hypothetical protein
MGQQDFSSTSLGSPENEAFAQGMRLYQQTEGKRVGLHYLLPLYEQDTKAFLQQMDLQDRSHERFSRVLAQRLVCALPLYKLMADMPQTASRYTARMPRTKQFNIF